MDIERTIYKTIFCNFPIQKIVEHLLSGRQSSDGDWFYDALKNTLHDADPSRNMQEVENLVCHYKDEYVDKIHPRNISTPLAGVFKLLKHCTERFLIQGDKGLEVNHAHFLGWNELTRKTGEDLLVCAWKGMMTNDSPTTFAWPNVTGCSGDVMAEIGKQPLCDVHTHLGGAVDPFIMNWLCLMTGGFMNDNQFKKGSDDYSSMRKWSVIAARIRIALYRKFILEERSAFGRDFHSCLNDLVGDSTHFLNGRNQVMTLASQIKEDGKLTTDFRYVDYAIRQDCEDEDMNSPYMLWHGERKLLYCFFKAYMTGSSEVKIIARYVYLYCLIKNQFIDEMVMTDKHMGLSYFSHYNNKKNAFVRDELKGVVRRYAFQTSMRKNNQDSAELRINPTRLELDAAKDGRLNRCIFTDGRWFGDEQFRNVTYLIHLSKSGFQEGSDLVGGRTYVQQLLENEFRQHELFTGIDAAGEEMICRPERLGHHFRYLRARGHRNFTYHVGEDFCDIADGLRAIEEAIVFLVVTKGWRLGHCVAMGINASNYYQKKNSQVYLTRQVLLDNLVWVLIKSTEFGIRIPNKLKQIIEKRASELYHSMGYETKYTIMAYYHSMWLRSDTQGAIGNREDNRLAWECTMKCSHPRSKFARKDSNAVMMAHELRVEDRIRREGGKQETWVVSKDYERVITKLQKKMMKIMKQLKVGIECNPTSNLMLCNLDRYDQEPLLCFRHVVPYWRSQLPVTINTDDKGLFTTSMSNEYALMACAISKQDGWIWKQEWSKILILNYLQDIGRRGFCSRFKWDNNGYESNTY